MQPPLTPPAPNGGSRSTGLLLDEPTARLRATMKRLICDCMVRDGATLALKAFRKADGAKEPLQGEAYVRHLITRAERAFHEISRHHAKQHNIPSPPARLDLLVSWVETEAYRWNDERLWNAHHLLCSIREAKNKPVDPNVAEGIATDTALLMAILASCLTDEIREERAGLTGWRRWMLLVLPKEADRAWLRALQDLAILISPALSFRVLFQE